MEMMDAEFPSSGWDHLPSELLLHIANCVGGAEGLASGKTLLRRVCLGWRAGLPLGHCKVWDWEAVMDRALAPHALHIELLAPLRHLGSGPLPRLAGCPCLHRLTLRHIRSAALTALSGLSRLQRLDATVLFTSASPGWLDWAAGLGSLRRLRITAATPWMQPEEGLMALLPLRRHLAGLSLDGCLLLTDLGAAVMAELSALERLELTCCQLSQAALDALAAALPRLLHAQLRLQDGMAADRLLQQTRIGTAGGSLTMHVTRHKANSLLAAAAQHMPGVGRVAVRHLGCGFLLTTPPTFCQLTALTALSLPHIQLPADATRQLAACTRLRELDVELTFTVRDDALLSWRTLAGMRRLRLAGSFYLTEAALAAVLGAMPRLQELRLEQVQGSGAMLAPLAAMPALHSLELASCHLNDAQALAAALCSARGLARLRMQSCGIQSEVCEAVVAALRQLSSLRELQLGLRRALAPSTADALALGCAGCTQLTALDVHFPGYAHAVPAVPTWSQLSTLSVLRRLHASTGVGWDAAAFAAVAGAATALRSVTITDNAGSVDARWAAALAPLRQLSRLELNSCRQLGAASAPLLCRLSALTSLACFRCHGLEEAAVVARLRASLPCLAMLSMQD